MLGSSGGPFASLLSANGKHFLMLQSMRLRCLTALLVLLLGLPATVPGQEASPELRDAAKRFSAAERQIKHVSPEEYRRAREELAQQALRLAETDLASADSEQLLHWILHTPQSTPAVMKAAQRLAEQHPTTELTLNHLMGYAQNPRAWTPDMFAAYGRLPLPRQQRALIAVYQAMHAHAMLDLADELSQTAPPPNVAEYEASLGPDLVRKLKGSDRESTSIQVMEAYSRAAEYEGKLNLGGVTHQQLADDAIFAIRHLRLGQKAQGLEGTTLDGKALSLGDYRGKVVLIDFWATWCAPCVGEVPHLRELASELDPGKFTLIGVTGDTEKPRVRDFLKDHKIDWPTILDPDNRLLSRWQARSLPLYYVLDEHHVVRYRGSNFQRAATVARSLLGPGDSAVVAELVAATLKALDANGNGSIEKSEFPANQGAIFKTADLNQDGSLSKEEVITFTKANLKSTKTEPPPPEK